MNSLELRSFLLTELKTYHRNPRKGDVSAIAESLKARGLYRPIVVNVGSKTGRANEILAGNHTYLAAKSLGWGSIQATLVDVDDEGAAQIVLADNRLAEKGGYDNSELLAVIEAAGSLVGTGFAKPDVDELLSVLKSRQALTEPDDVPAVPADPISVVGDVWELGEHRLLVGSSTDLDSVRSALPAEAEIGTIWTDPPYGVNYVGGTGLVIENDSPDVAVEVFAAAMKVAVEISRGGAPVYVAHADILRVPFQLALEAAGVRVRQGIVWVKDRLVMGRADYHYRHEPIFQGEVEKDHEPIMYGFAAGGAGRLGRGGEYWFGDNKQSTVIEVGRPKKSAEHPTMKPVELIEVMLKNSARSGSWVFDPFAGSGSTLIACENLGLKGLMVELDPKYADVILRRFQRYTGVLPTRGGVAVDFEKSSE